MNKIILDYSFLRSLLLKDDEKHDLAEQMVTKFRSNFTFYIPIHIVVQTMSLCDEYDNEIKETVLSTLVKVSRIQYLIKKEGYTSCLKKYKDIPYISYSDCLTLEYMKEKDIHNIISFNESLDKIRGVNRIYDFDKFNKNRLNFYER